MPSNVYFDDLRLDLLKQYAEQWVNDFKEVRIDRIELRRFSTPRRLTMPGSQASTLYAVVFWVLEADILPGHEEEEQKYHEKQITGEALTTPYEKFVIATKYNQTVRPRRYEALFGNDFKKVYKKDSFPEGKCYLDEWTFIPRLKDDKLPLNVKNSTPPVLLHPNNLCSNKITQKVGNLVENPEIIFGITKEANRCYEVYKRLSKDGKLSHENWINCIESMGLATVIPDDIIVVRLYHNPKHQKRNITTAITQQALKRIDPKNSYKVADIQKLCKETPQ